MKLNFLKEILVCILMESVRPDEKVAGGRLPLQDVRKSPVTCACVIHCVKRIGTREIKHFISVCFDRFCSILRRVKT